MKKTILNIVLAALCLNFASKAPAQTPTKPVTNQAIDVTSKGLQVGQQVPELPSLSKYKGKLIILDFWATWCSPCVAMIPKLKALQAQFNDQIQIVSVTYQTEDEVNAFLNKKGTTNKSNLAQITEDKKLHKLFPHIYLPHYIWIDPQGQVAAITGPDEISAANIQKMLDSQWESALLTKRDMRLNFDKTKPFLINGNGGDGSNLIYHSVLTGYTEGLSSKMSVYPVTAPQSRVVLSNTALSWFYRLAYADGGNKFYNKRMIRVQVQDSSKFLPPAGTANYQTWMRNGNTYCYELLMPKMNRPAFYQVMRDDLKRLFPQYQAAVKKERLKSLTLTRTSTNDKLQSTTPEGKPVVTHDAFGIKMKSSALSAFIQRLQIIYLKSYALPIVDGTGYLGKVDLELNANMGDVTELNRELKKYDLQFIEKEEEVELLYITDNKSN